MTSGASATLTSSGVYYARSTGAWILNSGTVAFTSFDHSGTAGLNLGGTGTKSVRNSTFYRNRYEMPDGSGGGQVYIGPYATNATVEDNTIDGADWQTGYSNINNCYPPQWPNTVPQAVYGIEVETGSVNNYLYSNDVKRNTGAGININSASGLTISGYLLSQCGYCYPRYVHDNTGYNPPFGNATDGIWFVGASQGISLNGILSRYNTGHSVSVWPGTGGYGWLGNHCLLPTYTTSMAFVYPYPLSTTTCP